MFMLKKTLYIYHALLYADQVRSNSHLPLKINVESMDGEDRWDGINKPTDNIQIDHIRMRAYNCFVR